MFPLLDQHLDVGSQLTWVCDAVAIPRARYAWYRNGKLLTSDSDIQVGVCVCVHAFCMVSVCACKCVCVCVYK